MKSKELYYNTKNIFDLTSFIWNQKAKKKHSFNLIYFVTNLLIMVGTVIRELNRSPIHYFMEKRWLHSTRARSTHAFMRMRNKSKRSFQRVTTSIFLTTYLYFQNTCIYKNMDMFYAKYWIITKALFNLQDRPVLVKLWWVNLLCLKNSTD